jgi:cell division protein FtsI (penicillin-binding protein 3)
VTSLHNRRLDAVAIIFIALLVFSLGRLFFIQFFRSSYLADLAKKQHNLFIELEPRRGAIYDTRLKIQAVNISVDSIYAAPNEIPDKDKETYIRALMPILHVEYDYLKDRLYRKKSFIWLARKVSLAQSEDIKSLNLKGIGFIKESKRCYPNGYLASQVIGFSGLDNVGLEGLELYYDQYLRGEPGWALYLRDAHQKKLGLWEKMVMPKDGYDVVLTIDEMIQYIAERELDKAFRKYHAKGASIIVMDPHTGAILALANRPTFDPNEREQINRDEIRNRALCDLFEPGSVFKVVTAAAALEEKKVSEENKFFCENGAYRVANHILHDHRPHGWLTFREVIEQSSNIGVAKVAQLLGNDTVYRYIRLFGFGSKLEVDLPGEINGVIREPRFWSKLSIATIPMGQEVGVTALQLVSAISVIANGGHLMKPYIVREVRDKYGEIIKSYDPVIVHEVISLDTAERLRKILTGVTEEGTGKLANIEGINVAGKTGTAQKLEPNGTYSHSKYVASFIGFVPAERPVIAIAVVVDEPRPIYYGGVVAAPVFKNAASDILKYLNIQRASGEWVSSHETYRYN